MRQKIQMQPTLTIGAAAAQPATDIVPVGNNRSGVVFLECYAIPSGTTVVGIQTVGDGVNTQQFSATAQWITLATITVTATGAQRVAITDLGESIRWNVSSVGAATTFRLVAFLSDQM